MHNSSLTSCGLEIDGLHLVIRGTPTCPQCARLWKAPAETRETVVTTHHKVLAKQAYKTALTAAKAEEEWREARKRAIDANVTLVLAVSNFHDPFAVAQTFIDMAVRNGDKPISEWT
jgi:hypothetical protein